MVNSRSPFFSIIIPAYNRAVFLPATINSVLEQTCFEFEILVIDDGSTDNTDDVMQPYLKDERVRYVKIENSERGAARNFGVQQSRGKYVTFLDSDDIFLPWHLATALGKIEREQNPPVFHLGYEVLRLDGRVDALPVLPNPVNRKLLEGNFLSCMGVFLRRDVALENRFDEDREMAGSEDYELWMRIAARYPILVFPDVTSRLINHDERSVLTTNPKKLIRRLALLDLKLKQDQKFIEFFGDKLSMFNSYRSLYLALHLALSGERWSAFKSLMYTVRAYPYVVLNYRFAVALKKILFM